MIKLPRSSKFGPSCLAVVYVGGGEVVHPHFHVAKKKVQKGRALHEKEVQASTGWNGYGGRWRPSDRSIYATAQREVREKAGIRVFKKDLILSGVVEIKQPKGLLGEILSKTVYFFTVTAYRCSDYPKETKKMGPPKLFSVQEAPYKEMRPADEVIIPIVMSGKTVKGVIELGANEKGFFIDKKEIVVGFA